MKKTKTGLTKAQNRRFRRLAFLEAVGKITSKQLAELKRLDAKR